jgi:hypothetical protein
MFNVFLPTLLEYRSRDESKEHEDTSTDLAGALWEVVIFTIGGCPGALVSGLVIQRELYADFS